MPDLNLDSLRDNYELLVSVLCLTVGGLCLLFGYIRMALDRRRLPESSLQRIRNGPSRRSTLVRYETWRSRSPLPWLAAVILLTAGTIISWTAVTPDLLLISVASGAIALAVLSYENQTKRRTTLKIGYGRVEVLRGGEKSAVEWQDVHAVRVSSDLSSLQVDGASTTVDVDLRPFDVGARIDISLALLGYASLRGVEVTAIQPLKTNVTLFGILELGHYVSIPLTLLAAFLISEQINLYGESNVLGLRCSANGAYFKERFSTPDRQGCVVLRVSQGSGVEKAGIRRGDMIVALDGTPITSGAQFTAVWGRYQKRTQTYRIARGSEPERDVRVSLSTPGKILEEPDDPLFYFLLGRGEPNTRKAIAAYDAAIKLEPNFDLAYAYRAEYRSGSILLAGQRDAALEDVNRAVQLDPKSSDVRRARANVLSLRPERQDEGLREIDEAMRLDGCTTAAKGRNADCMEDYIWRAQLLSLQSKHKDAAEAASIATEFFPDNSRPYYLAAREYFAANDLQSARKNATLFLAKDGGRSEEEFVTWAQGVLSEQTTLDKTVKGSEQPKVGSSYLDAARDQTIKGAPSITNIRFAKEKGSQPPPPLAAASPSMTQFWAYLDFANAPAGTYISWRWSRGGGLPNRGYESMRGISNGNAWLLIDNNLPGKQPYTGPGLLQVMIDGKTWFEAQLPFVDDAYISPVVFYEDAAATKPLLLYDGKRPIYMKLERANTVATHVTWYAEFAGRRVAGDDFIAESDSGPVTIEIKPNGAFAPGLLDVYLEAGAAKRSALVAVAPPEALGKPALIAFRTSSLLMSVSQLSQPVTYEVAKAPNVAMTLQLLKDGKPMRGPILLPPEGELSKGALPPLDGNDRTSNEISLVILQNDAPIYAENVVISR